jgi:glycosyltransferase involved in cell wall biosynthesis
MTLVKENAFLVSICIPTYNGVKYIREAFHSAILQTYRPLEIIVSDDDSKDGTVDIIKSFLNQTDIPIHIFQHEPSSIGKNWNNCVKKANGSYIKFLFQDDILEPDCVEILMKKAQEGIDVGLVFCKRKIIFDEQNNNHLEWVRRYGNLHEHWTNLRSLQSGKNLLKDHKFLKLPTNKVGEPTAVLLNKIVFSKVGYFDTQLKQDLDSEFWYRVFTQFQIAFVDQFLVKFRLHDEQATKKNEHLGISEYQRYILLISKHCLKYLHPISRIKVIYELLICIKMKIQTLLLKFNL